MELGLIGRGAIGRYVAREVASRGHEVSAVLVRPGRAAPGAVLEVEAAADIPETVDLMIDCAGHGALAAHGPEILARGVSMITLSIGALADRRLAGALDDAAEAGGSRLHLASGAIGALDCLAAAKVGGLDEVTYTGRKPPQGWKGSPAEETLDLYAMGTGAATHFEGSARDAALAYPKNANVAAAAALAGLGFDETRVRLIADPAIDRNVHEIAASGAFGRFSFQISGEALPDNPRSSALAAMSVLAKLDQITGRIAL
ncbi:MAG: aspartate dehydrogenase [Pseudomonadota bacterium]